MADEIDIQPEFEDEDELLDRLDNKEDGAKAAPKPKNPGNVVNDIPPAPTAMPFNPFAQQKETKKEQNEALRKQQKAQKEQQAQLLKELREQNREEARQARLQAKRLRAESRDTSKQARSNASANRVGAYVLGANLGFAGYAFSSMIDQAVFRPMEEKEAERQREYQNQLEAYAEAQRSQREAAFKQREQQIKDAPIEAVPVNRQGKPVPPEEARKKFLRTRPEDLPKNTQAPPVQGLTRAATGQPPKVTAAMPTQNVSPPMPPNMANILVAAGAVVQAFRFLTDVAGKTTKAIGDLGVSTVRGDVTAFGKAVSGGFRQVADPLGISPGTAIAVEGFNSLLDLNQAILDSSKDFLAFSPATLNATIEGQLAVFQKQVEVSRRNDLQTAKLVEVNTEMNLALLELKSEIITKLGPVIISLLKGLTAIAEGAPSGIEAVLLAAGISPATTKAILDLLGIVADNTQKDLMPTDIEQQIGEFFNPNQFAVNNPNMVPNP